MTYLEFIHILLRTLQEIKVFYLLLDLNMSTNSDYVKSKYRKL